MFFYFLCKYIKSIGIWYVSFLEGGRFPFAFCCPEGCDREVQDCQCDALVVFLCKILRLFEPATGPYYGRCHDVRIHFGSVFPMFHPATSIPFYHMNPFSSRWRFREQPWPWSEQIAWIFDKSSSYNKLSLACSLPMSLRKASQKLTIKNIDTKFVFWWY